MTSTRPTRFRHLPRRIGSAPTRTGADTFARVVYGTGSSLLVGVAAIVIALLLGVILGIGGTLTGRWGDVAVRRLIEVLYAFPPLVLALVCIALLGPSAETLAVAVGFGGAAGYARIIRARALVVTQSDYVFAARALGHPPSRILLHTMLPNIARPLLPLLTLGVAQSIVWATGLSFLGLACSRRVRNGAPCSRIAGTTPRWPGG